MSLASTPLGWPGWPSPAINETSGTTEYASLTATGGVPTVRVTVAAFE